MKLALALVIALAACGSSKPGPVISNTTPATTAPVAVAIVFNGAEIWVGNEEHESEAAAQYPGALNGLRTALAEQPPADALPAGSQGLVISYGEGATIRMPLGPIAGLTPDALGKQADYRSRFGSDLVAGVMLGVSELSKATPARRLLIVIGDGNDTNNDAAHQALAATKQAAQDANIEVVALVYKSAVSADGQVIDALTPNVQTVSSAAAFSAVFATLWQRR